eukprot:UN01629
MILLLKLNNICLLHFYKDNLCNYCTNISFYFLKSFVP